MRAPLSWLRDFAPFEGEPDALAATLDDLGLIVEGIERVGQGLSEIVVARVGEIAAIPGADRIRRVVVDGGDREVEVVCGATNFGPGDLVALAPVGATLPGGLRMERRTMKGVTSDGMLCSGRELGLSEDGAGLLLLGDVEGARPGQPLTEALGIDHDVVFDITVEGNRPDAWCMAGVARDLAARLHLPFALPTMAPMPEGDPAVGGLAVGELAVGDLATLVVEDPDLCPRVTARVLTEVAVGPSPRWLARRLTLAGLRPINNVVDASNYVMLELGQPTHPYDLDRLPGRGLRVRRARAGETVTTLDGQTRALGPSPGRPGSAEDLLICDAEDRPVGIAGVMGGASSEIAASTTRVLLEAAYFPPMVIARTSKRLGLRTEASARFERGCDPWALDRASARLVELLGHRAVPAPGTLDVRGDVPEPVRLTVPLQRVNALLGTAFDGEAVATLIEPLGFGCEPLAGLLGVTVPTNRPDVRPAPHGIDDVIEEVARSFGYSRLPRRRPAWPEPGRLSAYQRERRRVRDVACGLGASEAWTPSILADGDHRRMGLVGPAVAVANPLVADESVLRRSLLPGLLGAMAFNADRRQGDIRLYEVGTVFAHPDTGEGRRVERAGSGGHGAAVLPGEREQFAAVLGAAGDDARTAVAAWDTLAGALRVTGVELEAADGSLPGLHPTRSATLRAPGGRALGAVGEVDPDVAARFGVPGRVGWLEVDLGLLLDGAVTPRRPARARAASRFPSSDVDLAFVVDESVAAARVAAVLETAGGGLLESVALFDVFRGPAAGPGRRSLAYRLRFGAPDRTLTDTEVGVLRQACIDAVVAEVGATLR